MNVCKYLNYKFAHHHVHSEYSPMDAPVNLKKMVEYSKHLGYKTVTITDHGTVSAWVKLATYCKDNGLKPIFGIEGYFTQDRHLKHGQNSTTHHCLLLAKNSTGVKNIMRLSELANKEGYFGGHPRFDWELLEKYNEGVICTSSCVSGMIPYIFGLTPNHPDPKIAEDNTKDFEFLYKPYEKEGLKKTRWDLACRVGERFKKIFGENFYAEVQFHALSIEESYKDVLAVAEKLKIKLVGTNDVHYLKKEDANTQEVMMAINTGKCIKDPKRMRHDTNQFYLKSPEEMIEALGGRNAAAVQGALEIADLCVGELNTKTQLPSVEIPKNYNDQPIGSELDYLIQLSKEGLRRIGKDNDPVYTKRLDDEIAVIRRLREKGNQFDRYFLVVWDYVNWAWNNGIRVGAGRGSGAGSLVLYCLRITGIDPIKYDLLFERFLAEDRNEMPDIDIDFDHENGERVYAYVCQKYGVDHCARIGTFQEFHVASAIKAAFRVFDPGNMFEREEKQKLESEQAKKVSGKKGMQLGEKKANDRDESAALANDITKQLPKDPASGNPSNKCTLLKEKWEKDKEEYIYVYDAPEFVAYKKQYPEIFALAEKIEGLRSNRGVHAAGVLITEDELVNICPQQWVGAGENKNLATAFDMGDVEKVGGVKFDFLRTKALSVISRCLVVIEARYGKKIDIDNIVPDDRLTFELFERGDTTAIFQFESDGMREMLKNMKSITFEDLIAANALYRPGPMEHIPSYCKRKTGAEQVTYLAPVLAPILQPTLGIIVYQEQVMKATKELAGFTGPEADKVRKAMGKKKKEILDQMKEKFIKGCDAKKTVTPEIAQTLWGQMEKFGAYAFNKSHSAGYSYTAYQCAWLKAHYPEEFMACQLTVEAGDSKYEAVAKYESALKGMRIRLLDVSINESKGDYFVVDAGAKKAIRRGFKGVKGVKSAISDIEKGQPYKDMFDYCLRSGLGISSDVAVALIDAGAFDCFLPKMSEKSGRDATRNDLLNLYQIKSSEAKSERKEALKNKGRIGAFFVDDDEEESKRNTELVL